MTTMIKKGDRIRIKPEWQDPGDDKFIWVALEDEDGGEWESRQSTLDWPFCLTKSWIQTWSNWLP